LPQAGEHIAEVACAINCEAVGERVHPEGPVQAATDKGYHSNDTLTALAEAEVRTYISEPDRGRRRWKDKPEAQQTVYGNRRRIHGAHGKQLLRRRGELLERSFAHAYETGGMRRVYLRGRENVYKRVLIHLGWIQSVAGDAAVAGKRYAPRLAGIFGRHPVDGVAVLDCDPRCDSGKHIAADAQTFSRRARHHCAPTGGAVTKLLPPRTVSKAKLIESHSAASVSYRKRHNMDTAGIAALLEPVLDQPLPSFSALMALA
jgi:hypothetical protein